MKEQKFLLMGKAKDITPPPSFLERNPYGEKAPPSKEDVLKFKEEYYQKMGKYPNLIKYWQDGELVQDSLDNYLAKCE